MSELHVPGLFFSAHVCPRSGSCPSWLLGSVLHRHLCSNPAMRTVAHGTSPFSNPRPSIPSASLSFPPEKRGHFVKRPLQKHISKPGMRTGVLYPLKPFLAALSCHIFTNYHFTKIPKQTKPMKRNQVFVSIKPFFAQLGQGSRMRLAYSGVYLSQTMWIHAKNSMKKLKWPTSVF